MIDKKSDIIISFSLLEIIGLELLLGPHDTFMVPIVFSPIYEVIETTATLCPYPSSQIPHIMFTLTLEDPISTHLVDSLWPTLIQQTSVWLPLEPSSFYTNPLLLELVCLISCSPAFCQCRSRNPFL